MSIRTETFVIDLREPRRTRRLTPKADRTTQGSRTKMKPSRAYTLRIKGSRIRTHKELRSAFLNERGTRRPTVFISSTAKHLAPLAHMAHHEGGNLRLFVWEKVSSERREYLQTLFRTVVSVGGDVQLLASSELAEVLSANNRGDLFVGGAVNLTEDVVVLYRGSFDRLSIPLAWFRRTSDVEPDFSDFKITDYGQTVRFGNFEVSTDAILYGFDSNYRSRVRQRQLELDESFGGSLRRLRGLRGFKRSDFTPVSSKEIARIERGEVKEPRKATLEVIAKRLGVKPDEISTY